MHLMYIIGILGMTVSEFVALKANTKFVMIGNDRCPHCRNAESLLQKQPFPFVKINSDNERAVMDFSKAENNYRFIPQIYVCGEFIGGFQALQNYLIANGLINQ